MLIGRTDAEAEVPIFWRRAYSLEKTLMLEKTESKRRSGQQKIGWLESITNSTDMNLNRLEETVKGSEAWCVAVHGVTKS